MKSKRIRKKWQKKNGTYISPKDTWDLDYTIAEFVAPRLRLLAKTSCGYPGRGEMDTYEKWITAINTMAEAFELVMEDDLLGKYSPLENPEHWREECENRIKKIDEGLVLFAKYYLDLWD